MGCARGVDVFVEPQGGKEYRTPAIRAKRQFLRPLHKISNVFTKRGLQQEIEPG